MLTNLGPLMAWCRVAFLTWTGGWPMDCKMTENWTSVLSKPLCLCVLCYRNLACILYYTCSLLSVQYWLRHGKKVLYIDFVKMLLNQDVIEVDWRFGDNSTSHIRHRTALLRAQYRILYITLCMKVSKSYLLLWTELCPPKKYWSLNPWYLWMWPYLEIGSLLM